LRIFQVAKWRKCAACNWEAARLFFIAASRQDARDLLEEFNSGLCAECIVDIIQEHFNLQEKGGEIEESQKTLQPSP